MNILLHVDINIFSMLILALILSGTYERANRLFLQHRIFLYMILSTMVMLLLDSLAWGLDGVKSSSALFALPLVHLLYYILHPLPPMLWSLYAHYQVFLDEKRIKRIIMPLLIPFLVNAVLSILSMNTGFFFFLDQDNVYHRGPLFPLFAVCSYFYMTYALIIIFLNKNKVDSNHLVSLLLFPIPPALGGILQAFYYGLALTWSGTTLSLLVIYNNIQNRRLNTDPLTGLFNRRQLDKYLHKKIRNSVPERTFSALMIDVDNLKTVNDQFGHHAGDAVLKTASSLIRGSLRSNDLVVRYGGDEFLAILDISNATELKQVVERIKESVNSFNNTGLTPYQISLSIGYSHYDFQAGMSPGQFIIHIDSLMYKAKKRKKKQPSLP